MGNICSNYADQVPHQDINVAEFISVCIFLSEECGKVIRQVEESGVLKTMSKDDKSPVTIADITVQKTIEECLNTLYPSLNIQGEESKESTDTVDAAITADAITKARKKLITSKFLNIHHTGRMDFIEDQLRKTYTEDEISSSHFTTFNTKDAVVWIDPLDGTSDFIKGTLSAVTVLIGLSIKDKSRIGIVHNPYCAEDESVSKTIFGTGEAGAFKLLYNKDMTEQE